MVGIPRAWGVSRGKRQACECTNEVTTLLMTTESKIKDKHRSIMHMFAFIYRTIVIKSGLYSVYWTPKSLKLKNFLSGYISVWLLCASDISS